MTTEQAAYHLTAQDIAALKSCNRVCYRYVRADHISRLEVIKEADEKNVWEQRREIPCPLRIENYEEGRRASRIFASIGHYNYVDGPINTFIALLRPGDIIRAHVIANNYTAYAKEMGLYVDFLELQIARQQGGKQKILTFMVDVSCCPNNLARMVQSELGSEFDRD